MALSPGGFAIMICMPIVGWLLSRYDARYLLMFGLSMLSFSLFHMTNFDLKIDFQHRRCWLASCRPSGLPSCSCRSTPQPMHPSRGKEQCCLRTR